MSFAGQVALVTGASRGLGRAIAERLAQDGAKLLLCARDQAALSRVCDKIRQSRGAAEVLVADICEPQQVDTAVQAGIDQAGRLDIVVNAAGAALLKSLQQTGMHEWLSVINTNLTGTFLITQAAVRYWLERKLPGKILNISSALGKTGSAMGSAYSAAKFGVVGFTQAVAKELLPYNIQVNAICPGAMDTDMLHRDTVAPLAELYRISTEEMLQRFIAALPMKRLLQPSEVAEFAAYILSDKGAAFNGQAFNMTGGLEVH